MVNVYGLIFLALLCRRLMIKAKTTKIIATINRPTANKHPLEIPTTAAVVAAIIPVPTSRLFPTQHRTSRPAAARPRPAPLGLVDLCTAGRRHLVTE